MKTKRRINAAYDRRARTPGRRTTTGMLTKETVSTVPSVAAPCACKGTCGSCATVPVVEDRLTTVQRNDLPPSEFALPERRELPISDAAHIKPAAARLSMMRHEHHVSPAEYEQARHRIITAGNRFGIYVSEKETKVPFVDRGARESSGVQYMDPSRITLADPDVLSFVRFEVQELVDRGQYPSKEVWAESVLSGGKPVDLFLRDGRLVLVDGNHRYYAATVLHRSLPVVVVNPQSHWAAHEERGLTWAQRSNGIYWANGLGGTYYLMPQPSGDYQVVWTERNGNQQDLGVHSFASATQVAARFVPHEGRVAVAAEAPTAVPVCGPWVRMEKDVARFEACQALSQQIGPVTGHDSLYRYIRPQMDKEDVEVYYAIIVDTQMQVRGFSEIARGARDSVMTPIPDTMRVAIHYAIQYGAMGLCIAHCHPSGIAKPSKADHGVTAAAKSGCEAVGICFLDHLIVGSKSYYSFAAKNRSPQHNKESNDPTRPHSADARAHRAAAALLSLRRAHTICARCRVRRRQEQDRTRTSNQRMGRRVAVAERCKYSRGGYLSDGRRFGAYLHRSERRKRSGLERCCLPRDRSRPEHRVLLGDHDYRHVRVRAGRRRSSVADP